MTKLKQGKPLSFSERDAKYNQILSSLLTLNIPISAINGITRLKIIAKIYRDYGNEFIGEIQLPSDNIIIYEFWNNTKKKTFVKITNNANQKCKTEECQNNDSDSDIDNIPTLVDGISIREI
jgi:hypothetical protein